MSISDLEYQRLADLRHQLRVFLAFSEQQARAAGLNPQQHQLLLAVRGAETQPPGIGELARRLVLRHHSTVELVDRLEAHGMVQRTRASADRRQAGVVILPAGERVLEKLSLIHRAELRKAAPVLIQSLVSLLQAPRPGARKRTPRVRRPRRKDGR